MNRSAAKIVTVVSIPFEENTYIAQLEGRRDCLVVDPGLEPEKIFAALEAADIVPDAILCTHGHSDHIGGNAALKQRWPDCPLVIGQGDAEKLTNPALNLSGDLGLPLVSPAADRLVAEGDVLSVAGFELEVRETPGHSRGHVVYVWAAGSPAVVFAGDVLFCGGVGRTDFFDGDFDALRAGIQSKLFTLPDATVVLPGHGGPTTIGEEKRTNPFVGAPAGYAG